MAEDNSAPANESTASTDSANDSMPVDTEQVTNDARAAMLKELGFDDLDALKGVVKSHNDEVAANQTELEASKGQLDKANSKLNTTLERAENAEAQVAALQQGVNNDHLADALALAKVDLANKETGVKTINDALAAVLARNPAFKDDSSSDSTAVAGKNLNGGNTHPAERKSPAVELADKLNEGRITH